YQNVDYNTIPSATPTDPQHQIEVWKIVGGPVGAYGEDPVKNSCATRVSYGLNYGGNAIPDAVRKKYKTAFYNDNTGKDKFGKKGDCKDYITGAWDMHDYLKDTWGNPDTTLKNAA